MVKCCTMTPSAALLLLPAALVSLYPPTHGLSMKMSQRTVSDHIFLEHYVSQLNDCLKELYSVGVTMGTYDGISQNELYIHITRDDEEQLATPEMTLKFELPPGGENGCRTVLATNLTSPSEPIHQRCDHVCRKYCILPVARYLQTVCLSRTFCLSPNEADDVANACQNHQPYLDYDDIPEDNELIEDLQDLQDLHDDKSLKTEPYDLPTLDLTASDYEDSLPSLADILHPPSIGNQITQDTHSSEDTMMPPVEDYQIVKQFPSEMDEEEVNGDSISLHSDRTDKPHIWNQRDPTYIPQDLPTIPTYENHIFNEEKPSKEVIDTYPTQDIQGEETELPKYDTIPPEDLINESFLSDEDFQQNMDQHKYPMYQTFAAYDPMKRETDRSEASEPIYESYEDDQAEVSVDQGANEEELEPLPINRVPVNMFDSNPLPESQEIQGEDDRIQSEEVISNKEEIELDDLVVPRDNEEQTELNNLVPTNIFDTNLPPSIQQLQNNENGLHSNEFTNNQEQPVEFDALIDSRVDTIPTENSYLEQHPGLQNVEEGRPDSNERIDNRDEHDLRDVLADPSINPEDTEDTEDTGDRPGSQEAIENTNLTPSYDDQDANYFLSDDSRELQPLKYPQQPYQKPMYSRPEVVSYNEKRPSGIPNFINQDRTERQDEEYVDDEDSQDYEEEMYIKSLLQQAQKNPANSVQRTGSRGGIPWMLPYFGAGNRPYNMFGNEYAILLNKARPTSFMDLYMNHPRFRERPQINPDMPVYVTMDTSGGQNKIVHMIPANNYHPYSFSQAEPTPPNKYMSKFKVIKQEFAYPSSSSSSEEDADSQREWYGSHVLGVIQEQHTEHDGCTH